MSYAHLSQDERYQIQHLQRGVAFANGHLSVSDARLLPLYCKQDIFIFYIQWLIFLLIGNTMKNTMLRKGLTIF